MHIRIVFLLFTTLAVASAAQSSYIQLKGVVAQYLLDQAWEITLETGQIKKPWPWADTWPVAKMIIPSQHKSVIVLEGNSGEAMAFGPARLSAKTSTSPGQLIRKTLTMTHEESDTTVIGGHRDTHLAFLQHMEQGQIFVMQTAGGQLQSYKWINHIVANADTDSLTVASGQSGLVLVTCYPFNAAQTGGPLRFVVIAERVDASVSRPSYSSRFFSKGYLDIHS